MAFETGVSTGHYAPPPPDFSAAISTYNDMVTKIGTKIKAAEAQLTEINNQIGEAQDRLRATYSAKIQASEDRLKIVSDTIDALLKRQADLESDIVVRQQQHDSIDLSFIQKQKELDDSWADFHVQASQLIADQKQLKVNQDGLAVSQAQLLEDQKAWGVQKQKESEGINQLLADASDKNTQATNLMATAINKMNDAQAVIDAASVAQQKLDERLATAQPILDQADMISKQKVQNDIDAKNNSVQALQNQSDAEQIKVMRIAVNNQQQSVAAREQAVALAEQKIGG